VHTANLAHPLVPDEAPRRSLRRHRQRAARDPELALGGELLREFRSTEPRGESPHPRRTVGDLRALAETERERREKAAAARKRKAKDAADRARNDHLSRIGKDVEGAWTKLEQLVDARGYDDAVRLAIDLRNLAEREGESTAFGERFAAMRKRQLKRPTFFKHWKRAIDTKRD